MQVCVNRIMPLEGGEFLKKSISIFTFWFKRTDHVCGPVQFIVCVFVPGITEVGFHCHSVRGLLWLEEKVVSVDTLYEPH